jgi:signal peptidase
MDEGVINIKAQNATLASISAPAGPHQYGVVSTEVDAPSPQIILSGTSETTKYAVDNAGFVPVVVLIDDSDSGVVAHPTELFVGRHSRATTVTLSAPPELGYYRRVIVEHRYLAVLPPATIRTLYELHPWLPIVVIDVLLGVPFYVFGTALVGSARLRDRSRPRALSRLARLRLRCSGFLRTLR